MKGISLFGITIGLTILGIAPESVMAQYKQAIHSLPDEKELYGQARSSRQVAVLFRPLLPKLQRETKVPILLPSELEFFSQRKAFQLLFLQRASDMTPQRASRSPR